MTTTQELFGEVIYKYDEEDALKDGVLVPNLSRIFTECDLLTNNLWMAIRQKCGDLGTCMAYLDAIMQEAEKMYYGKHFKGDNDENFFIIKGFAWPVWFVRNGNNKLTAMLPSDY